MLSCPSCQTHRERYQKSEDQEQKRLKRKYEANVSGETHFTEYLYILYYKTNMKRHKKHHNEESKQLNIQKGNRVGGRTHFIGDLYHVPGVM